MTQQPRTRRELRASQRRAPGVVIAIVALIIVVLGAAVWFGKDTLFGTPTSTSPTTATSSSPSPTATETSTTQTSTATSTPTQTVDPLAAQVAACSAGWKLQAAARTTAATTLAEWKRHLDIMNDLQAGKISLATAKARWPATTAQAPQHIAAFHAADQAYTASKQRCTALTGDTTSVNAKALATCAASMQVVDGILAKARTAIEPWETHLKDQSHFKAGGMTAARAEALWRSLWQKGLRLNPPYFNAVVAGAKATCPLAG